MIETDWQIEAMDILDWAAQYDGPKFHALLCDPPYELGFMGKDWDRSGIAFKPDTWATLAEHLHPGAFGMAFASARGWHRLAVAIEDAGLRIHPSIFGWSYGSGFPKATRIDTQVDKAAGAKGKIAGRIVYRKAPTAHAEHSIKMGAVTNDGKLKREWDIVEPATPLAQAWQGHRYGLQALKPALEPIIVFQVPYQGKPVDCITETGAGAPWIDGGRIGLDNTPPQGGPIGTDSGTQIWGSSKGGWTSERQAQPQGRWPANFCLVHHPECVRVGTRRVRGTGIAITRNKDAPKFKQSQVYGQYHQLPADDMTYADPDGLETIIAWDCVPECPVRRLGEQSGRSKSPHSYHRNANGFNQDIYGSGMGEPAGKDSLNYGDKGTAARFFHQSDWSYEIAERLAGADPVLYQAKASRKERDAGLEGMSDVRNDWDRKTSGMNRGTIERAGGRKTEHAPKRNAHPTIKPIALARWLATLLLPPPEYAPRRILIPFSGSGSEGIGAGLAGWDDITMIDNEAEYCQIAEARMTHWLKQPEQLYLYGG